MKTQDHDVTTPAARRRLMDRLDAIAHALAGDADALGLLALGSVGDPLGRVDAHSDLDFFVLVRNGAKARFIDDLWWLQAAQPVDWQFRNTADGCKALMRDGVFCEFAVFEVAELAGIPYAPGRFVWRRDALDPSLATPQRALPAPSDAAWLVGEALSNLLIGLHRHARGEGLAAMRLVQVAALDRVLELREQQVPVDRHVARDPFAVDRRVEMRQADAVAVLPAFAGGYRATPQAALALLAALETLQPVNAAVAAEIRKLAAAT